MNSYDVKRVLEEAVHVAQATKRRARASYQERDTRTRSELIRESIRMMEDEFDLFDELAPEFIQIARRRVPSDATVDGVVTKPTYVHVRYALKTRDVFFDFILKPGHTMRPSMLEVQLMARSPAILRRPSRDMLKRLSQKVPGNLKTNFEHSPTGSVLGIFGDIEELVALADRTVFGQWAPAVAKRLSEFTEDDLGPSAGMAR